MTRPCNYNFADYLDLLNERFKLIRSIVLGLHNEEVAKVIQYIVLEVLHSEIFMKGILLIVISHLKN